MDRRDFLKVFLAAPLFPGFLPVSPRSSSLFLLSDTPHLVFPSLLQHLPLSLSPRPSFAFLNTHPLTPPLRRSLLRRGWNLCLDPAAADVVLSFLSLLKPAPPSFTLVQDGRIRDIRTSALLALWKTMQTSSPSTLLTVASFPGTRLSSPARTVSVFHRGREKGCLPLSGSLTRTFEDSAGTITVRVERGRAWVSEASCARQICRHSPPVARPGERIICAPNHFLLAVTIPHSIDTSIG